MTDDGEEWDDSASPVKPPEQYYDEFGAGEWDRLEANPVTRFEYENTIDVRETHLPYSE